MRLPHPQQLPDSGARPPRCWAQTVLTLLGATQQGKGSLGEVAGQVGPACFFQAPPPHALAKNNTSQGACCCWQGWTMHKTSAGQVSSSEWLHSEHAGVKGLWEGSLSFLKGLEQPWPLPGPPVPLLCTSYPGPSLHRGFPRRGWLGTAFSSQLSPKAFFWTPLMKEENCPGRCQTAPDLNLALSTFRLCPRIPQEAGEEMWLREVE